MKTTMLVSTDKSKIQEVLERGVAVVYPNPEFLRTQLASGKRLTVYLGIDPTGPALHLGHAIPLMKLAQFQKLGHTIILLIGDFTALSGDPDKTEARKRQTREDVLANCKSYKKQASKILSFSGENAAEYRFNSTWLGKMSFGEVVELASKITVPRLLERDLFQRRIKEGKGLFLHEFLYPLMQGYDSVAMEVDGEVGGTDQTFNMLTGRDLMKAYKNKEKFVIAMKLLEDPTGKKMGKTEGNMVALTDAPGDMFGKVMSWTDGMIGIGFELLTDVPITEIHEREALMKKGALNPRDAKAELARRLVAMFHGEQKAKKAEHEFTRIFKQKETPDEIPPSPSPAPDMTIVDFLVREKLCNSKSEARRLVEQGAVKVNQTKVTDWKNPVSLKTGDIVQVGKRKFIRIA